MEEKNRNGSEGQGGKRPFDGKSWQERKLEKANRDDFDVISRKTTDQGDFIGMLNTLDNALYKLRMNMGRSQNIPCEKALEFIGRGQRIKEEINLLNAEMCREMGWHYRPPRGFTNPLGESEEKKQVKKGASAKAPGVDKLSDATVTAG